MKGTTPQRIDVSTTKGYRLSLLPNQATQSQTLTIKTNLPQSCKIGKEERSPKLRILKTSEAGLHKSQLEENNQ